MYARSFVSCSIGALLDIWLFNLMLGVFTPRCTRLNFKFFEEYLISVDFLRQGLYS